MYKVVKDFFDKGTGHHFKPGDSFPKKDQKVEDLRISNLIDWGYIEDEVIDGEDLKDVNDPGDNTGDNVPNETGNKKNKNKK